MDVKNMTYNDFMKVPQRDSFDTPVPDFDAIVILPLRVPFYRFWFYKVREYLHDLFPKVFAEVYIEEVYGIHDSGFRMMDFVACFNGEPIMRISGSSDVLHLDGIGGYGYNWLQRYGTVPMTIPPAGWNIDCLPVSGLIRLFRRGLIGCGLALSSFEIYNAGNYKEEIQESELSKAGDPIIAFDEIRDSLYKLVELLKK